MYIRTYIQNTKNQYVASVHSHDKIAGKYCTISCELSEQLLQEIAGVSSHKTLTCPSNGTHHIDPHPIPTEKPNEEEYKAVHDSQFR